LGEVDESETDSLKNEGPARGLHFFLPLFSCTAPLRCALLLENAPRPRMSVAAHW
jgi:hypothetical protein